MKLSVVTTLYRSAPHLEEFHTRLSAAAEGLTGDYELILVNDCSPDRSLDVALSLHERDPRLRIVDLSRNFGHHKASMTGLAHAQGDLVFLIDCDLAEDPILLQQFHEELTRTSADVIYGVQDRRECGFFERLAEELFFRVFNLLSDHPLPLNLTTVRLMTRRYVQALVQNREREMIVAGLWVITGFTQVPVVFEKRSRGASSYTLACNVAQAVNAVTSFSSRPLVFIFYLGCGVVVAASAAAMFLVVRRLFFGTLLAGWPSLIVSVWLLGGLAIFCIGVVGIYLSKVFMEIKQRPYTIVREIHQRPSDGP